ncbi:MAG: hypothetical protein Q8M31_09125 [Beijerinckiaceae bacterium]|nr:hypothetical protein [Beijerinckiaceae bacterium]
MNRNISDTRLGFVLEVYESNTRYIILKDVSCVKLQIDSIRAPVKAANRINRADPFTPLDIPVRKGTQWKEWTSKGVIDLYKEATSCNDHVLASSASSRVNRYFQ